MSRMRSTVMPVIIGGLVACSGRDATPEAGDPTRADSAAANAGAVIPACYRADGSVMGRESPLTGRVSTAPGWIRLESAGADSGAASLVDGDGAGMNATWKRAPSDSVAIVAFDDFLRVELKALRSSAGLTGSGLATSDAELVRDSAGRMRDLRREWMFAARPVTCDSVPPRAQR